MAEPQRVQFKSKYGSCHVERTCFRIFVENVTENARPKVYVKTCCTNMLVQHIAQLVAALETCCQHVTQHVQA